MKSNYLIVNLLFCLIVIQGYAYDFPKEILNAMPEFSENYADRTAKITKAFFGGEPYEEEEYGFVIPNEHDPASARSLYERLEVGTTFMSVGSERAFFGGALSKADRLFIVDRDIDICLFAHVNRALLKVSNDRQDYVWLRLHASEKDWEKRLKEKGILFEGKHEIEAVKIIWKYWNNRVRNVKSDEEETIRILSSDIVGGLEETYIFDNMHNGTAFIGANYLFQDELFNHLRELAISNKINIYNEDITKLNENSKLIQDIKSQNIILGMIEISNVYNIADYCNGKRVLPEYITTLEFAKFIFDIAPYTNKNSWIVATDVEYYGVQVFGLLPNNIERMLLLYKEVMDMSQSMCKSAYLFSIIDDLFMKGVLAPSCLIDRKSWPTLSVGRWR